ncbi:MAG TPA: GMC family oxidoreductase [Gemmatimonadales bacterium]
MKTRYTDVLIIGTGFGGAAPALRLAEAGFKVTMVEKGPAIDPHKDFRQTQDPKYLLRYLKGLSGDHLSFTYAEALGGGSGFYEMVSLRAPSQAFDLVDQSGARLWPSGMDRQVLDPYYDVADRMLRVEQIAPEVVPKSGLVFSLLMKNLGYSCERARYAVQGCLGSGFCVTGCVYGAKQSLLINYLPQAVAAGAIIETDLDARVIRPMEAVQQTPMGDPVHQIPYRYEVLCQRRSGPSEMIRFRARILILAGGTVGTATLLLKSRVNLPLLSDQVGQNIAFNGSVKAAGILPDHFADGDMFAGRSHPGMISYEFLESRGITISAAKPLPLQAVAAARLRLDGDDRDPWYWGAANVELMRQYRHRLMVLVTFGMTPPLGRLELQPDGRRALHLGLSDDLRAYAGETKELLHSILRRNGCRIVQTAFLDSQGVPQEDLHFSTAHQVGSCRMADTKKRGVTRATGEVFDYPGMYVTDGSAIPSSLAVNTSLTILANAERIATGILSTCLA